MTLKLPAGWGPATTLAVLYFAVTAVVGGVDWAQGELGSQAFLDSLKFPAGALGLVGIGRGIAYGGQGTGFGSSGGTRE